MSNDRKGVSTSGRMFVTLNSTKSPNLVDVIPGFEHLAESLNYIDTNGNDVSVWDVIKNGEHVDVVVPSRKISQPVYDAMVRNAQRSGVERVVIPAGIDTSDISMELNIPHDFGGHNIVGMVPKNSNLGDHVTIHNGAVIEGCKVGVEAVVGEEVVFKDSYIGVACECGNDVSLINCIVDAGFASPSAELIDNCRINMGFSVGRIEHFKDDNVMLPGFYIDEINQMGNDNVTLSQGRFPVPEIQGSGNVRVDVNIDKLPKQINDNNLYASVRKWKSSNHAESLWDKAISTHDLADSLEPSDNSVSIN